MRGANGGNCRFTGRDFKIMFRGISPNKTQRKIIFSLNSSGLREGKKWHLFAQLEKVSN